MIYYELHIYGKSASDCDIESPECLNPKICYSIFVKNKERGLDIIWKYHKFSKDLLGLIYNQKNKKNQKSRPTGSK